jgi:hypothetical protein
MTCIQYMGDMLVARCANGIFPSKTGENMMFTETSIPGLRSPVALAGSNMSNMESSTLAVAIGVGIGVGVAIGVGVGIATRPETSPR